MSTNQEVLRNNYSYPGFTINWGAIFAGLVLILSVGWLLFAFSSAIGLSIIDIEQFQANDMTGKAKSVGVAATLWMIVTAVITYFLGGFLSGKVSGKLDQPTGTLHGVVLWSCTIIISMIFSAIGVGSIVSTATSAAKSAASTGFNTATIIAAQSSNDGNTQSSDNSFLYPLVGSLKQGITKALTQAEQNSNDEEKSAQDSNQSFSTNEKSQAKNGSDNQTDFSSDRDVNKFSDENEGKSSSENKNDNYQHSDQKSAEKRIRKMIDRTDPQIFAAAAIALIQGNEKQAKEILSSHLDIDEAELNKVIKKVQEKAEVVADEMKEKAEKAKEYATGALWAIILSYLAALLACIGGAHLGTRCKDRAI